MKFANHIYDDYFDSRAIQTKLNVNEKEVKPANTIIGPSAALYPLAVRALTCFKWHVQSTRGPQVENIFEHDNIIECPTFPLLKQLLLQSLYLVSRWWAGNWKRDGSSNRAISLIAFVGARMVGAARSLRHARA